MNIFLDDTNCRSQLVPFTLTRHVADLRVGILTIREKWEKLTGKKVYTSRDIVPAEHLPISAGIIPTPDNFQAIIKAAYDAVTIPASMFPALIHPWHIFLLNDWAMRHDFELLTAQRSSQPISPTNRCSNEAQIFIEEGAIVEHSVLNAATGPVYIGKNAMVMEGCLVRGPFALGEESVLKMGSRMYGATSIGPHCTAGGEIKNSVFFEYSNKAHDGYLGDSVLGAWCNLGAGTSNSNVKNTGSAVKYYLDKDAEPIVAGTKAGLLMGDYSRAAINTSFNTGTVVGVCCNIFGQSFPPKYVRNFSWGYDRYVLEKALQDIENWKKMKQRSVTPEERETLQKLFLSNQ